MSESTSIVLVDDHTVVRNGLKILIERMGAYKVTDQYDNGKQFIDALPLQYRPDVVIMDLSMPIMGGKETVIRMKEHKIDYPVLILTLDTTEKMIVDLFRQGVRGYIPKSCTADVLRTAIDDIIDTGYYHNELLTKALLTDTSTSVHKDREEVLQLISEREKTFLQLVCNEAEYTYDQIADIMKVHRRTVDGYRESLFDKFKIKSKTGLVLFAIKYRLIDIPIIQ